MLIFVDGVVILIINNNIISINQQYYAYLRGDVFE